MAVFSISKSHILVRNFNFPICFSNHEIKTLRKSMFLSSETFLTSNLKKKNELWRRNYNFRKKKNRIIMEAQENEKNGYFDILKEVSEGLISPSDAALLLDAGFYLNKKSSNGSQEFPVDDFARIDSGRSERTGFPEVVWGPGKTPEQIASIMEAMAEKQFRVMATRISSDVHEKVKKLLPGVIYHPVGRILTYISEKDKNSSEKEKNVSENDKNISENDKFRQPEMEGKVAILSAGTSDLFVAEEARITAEVMGCQNFQIFDIGVAGLHRLLRQLPSLLSADVIIVAAGMDGALPSVVAGLVEVPVIAVPTSIGYGAAFGGISPLLGALNSCSPGVLVVNIDNGFGAAMAAARIIKLINKKKKKQ